MSGKREHIIIVTHQCAVPPDDEAAAPQVLRKQHCRHAHQACHLQADVESQQLLARRMKTLALSLKVRTSHQRAKVRLCILMGRWADSVGCSNRAVSTLAQHRHAPVASHSAGTTTSRGRMPHVHAAAMASHSAGRHTAASTSPAQCVATSEHAAAAGVETDSSLTYVGAAQQRVSAPQHALCALSRCPGADLHAVWSAPFASANLIGLQEQAALLTTDVHPVLL